MGKKSHIMHRDNDTGRFVTERDGKRRPASTTREHVPNPGRGDVDRKGKK